MTHHKLILVLLCLLLIVPLAAQDAENTLEPQPAPTQEVAAPLTTDLPSVTPTDIPGPMPTEEITLVPSETPSPVVTEATQDPTPVSTTEEIETTPVLITTLPVLNAEPPLTLVVREMFSTAIEAAVWHSAGWSAREGVEQNDPHLFAVGDATTGDTTPLTLLTPYGDVAAAVDYALSAGSIQASVQGGVSTVTVDTTGLVTLWTGETALATAQVTLQERTWHTLRLSVIGGVIRVAIDEAQVLTAPTIDSVSGVISISGMDVGESGLAIDNVFVWQPTADVSAPPTNTVEIPLTQSPVDTDDTVVAQMTHQGTLAFGTPQSRSMSADGHSWAWWFDRWYDGWIFDVKPQAGSNLRYKMNLVGPGINNWYESSADGRGIIWEWSAAGNYMVYIYPYAGQASGNYEVTLWSCCKPRFDINWGIEKSYSHIRDWRFNYSGGQSYVRMFVDSGYSMTYNWIIYGDNGDTVTPNFNNVIASGSSNSAGLAVAPINVGGGWYHWRITPTSGEGSIGIAHYWGSPWPGGVGNLRVENPTPFGGTLRWDDAPNETLYRVSRKFSSSQTFTLLAELPAGTTSYIDTTAQCMKNYTYKVESINQNGRDERWVDFSTNICPPANDHIANAQAIQMVAASSIVTLPELYVDSATTQSVDTANCATVKRSVWYKYTPTVAHALYLGTADSSYDTVLAVYKGTPDALTQVACNDDRSSLYDSGLLVDVVVGSTYYILVGQHITEATANNLSLTLHIVRPTTPPPPTLSTPITGKILNSSTPTLTYTATEACSTYEIQVDTETTFAAPLSWSQTGVYLPSVETTPLSDGLYYWRVRCLSYFFAPSAWSTPIRSFRIDTTDPSVPLLKSPAHEAITPSFRPVLSWNAATDTTPVKYRVEVALDENFTQLVNYPATSLQTTALALTLLPVPRQGQYWWRVMAQDGAGNDSGVSEAWSFTINAQLTPAHNAILSSATPALRPKFTWTGAAGATGYRVVIARDQDFTYDVFTSANLPALAVSYTIPANQPGLAYGEWYWKLEIINKPDVSPVYRRFIVSPPVPPVPVITTPLQLAQSSSPTLAFNPVVYNFGSVSYEITVENTATAQTPEWSQSGLLNTYTMDLSTDGVYAIRVRSVNEYGLASAWSVVRTFTYDTTAPDTPVIVSPTNHFVTGVVRPTLVANTPVGTVGWLWDIAYDADFNYTVAENMPAAAASFVLSAAVLPTPLDQGSYFLRVQARDKAGNISLESSVTQFSVNLAAAPAHNTAIVSATPAKPVFKWTAAGIVGASYTVQVSRDADFTDLAYESTPLPALTVTLPAAQALSHGSYWWRVVVNGMTPPPEIANRFSVTNALPAAPSILTPTANGQLKSAVLSWSPVSTAVKYQAQCDNVTTFTSIDVNVVQEATSLALDGLADGSWTCRVRSLNAHDAFGAFSVVRSFILDNVAPNAPLITAPGAGATVTVLNPTITWGGMPTSVGYIVEISAVETFATKASFSTAPVTALKPTPATTLLIPTPLTSGLWFARVAAIDLAGNQSAWSATRSFSIALATVQLNRYTSATPTLTFAPIIWATGFEVVVSSSITFAGTPVWSSNTIAGNATSVTVGSPLLDGTYFMRLRVKKPDGTWGAWSSIKSFVVDS